MTGTDGNRRQLRFALSMNGGVSLAVWIGGAVAEIDAIRTGDPFWSELLTACGYQPNAQVDVMSGASAGGLNAVMMAQAIRTNTPYEKYLELWRTSADIATLVKDPRGCTETDTRAVFRGDYFLTELEKALKEKGEPKDLEQDLAVFASATLVRQNDVELRDVPGAPIAESRSDAYFHIARRGDHERGLDGFRPSDVVVPNVTALAMVGRATSSLPGLFEPVRFQNGPVTGGSVTSDCFGSRLVGAFTHDRQSVEIMDGGVIDNVPIARAIRAIANSAASTSVRRVLLYLHPDPETAGPSVDPTDVVGVVRSFFGKRKETIREDIEVLRTHNDAVERRAATAEALLHDFLDSGATIQRTAGDRLASDIAEATLLRAAIEPSGEFTWHAPNVGRLSPLVDGPGQPSKADMQEEIENALSTDPHALPGAERRRVVATLQRLIGMAGAGLQGVDFSDATEQLNECLLLADIIHSYQLARFLGHGGGGGPGARLLDAAKCIRTIGVQQPDAPEPEVWRALASWDVICVVDRPGVPLLDSLDRMIAAAINKLPDLSGAPADPEGAAAKAARALLRFQQAPDDHVTIDRLFLPLAAEPTASDQQIDFVRIAGNVSSPAADAFIALAGQRGPKIAGTQLGHLGAFFAEEWRTNDWWWGRLDAVESLLDAVLDEQAITTLLNSNYLQKESLATTGTATTDIKFALRHERQRQLIDRHLGTTSDTLADAVATDEFKKWARRDRRLSSLIGTRSLTSTAIRGTITTARTLELGKGPLAKGLLIAGRPLLLAGAGITLAGRRASAALIWSLCALAAPRAAKSSGQLGLYLAGILAALATIWLVETRVRPTTGRWWPYSWAAAGALVGGFAGIDQDWWKDHNLPVLGWSLWWLLAAGSAAISAWMLFFWMRRTAMVGMVGAIGLVYAAFAYRAALNDSDHPVFLDIWPLRSMWVAWLLSVFSSTLLLGRLRDWMLKPTAPST